MSNVTLRIGGRDFVKTMVEWNLPPIRFRRAGAPSFYLTWARPALFASGIETKVLPIKKRNVVVSSESFTNPWSDFRVPGRSCGDARGQLIGLVVWIGMLCAADRFGW